MIINLIKQNLFPSLTFGGLRAGDVMERNLNAHLVSSPADALSLGGVTCLLYDDVPLLSEKTLRLLYRRCRKEKTGFRLGKGSIVSDDYNGPLRFFPSRELRQVSLRNYPYLCDAINALILAKHRANGVIFRSPDAQVDFDVQICAGAFIGRNVTLEGNTYIGENARIEDDTHVLSSTIGEGCKILSSRIEDSSVGAQTVVGPFAYLRKGTIVGNHCRIGDFVEIKNSVLSDGVKAAHLTYIGDGEVGKHTNVGCGTVFCNYDGKVKRKVKVGENVFIGANTNLVAPLTVGDHAFIAAGGTVTESVPPSSFVIARSKQTTKKKK